MAVTAKTFDYARAGELVHGLVYRYDDSVAFNEYYAFGKPDWMPVGLLLMHHTHDVLSDILAAMMGRHNVPPAEWFDALKWQGDKLLYNRERPAPGKTGRALPAQVPADTGGTKRTPVEEWRAILQKSSAQVAKSRTSSRKESVGWILQDSGYFWLMRDAASRAIPLHNGIVLEASSRFAENIEREEFKAVRRACADYLETILDEAAALIAQQEVAVEGQLIRSPGYDPFVCEIDATP